MSVDLALMRRDFHQAAAWEGWPSGDQAEIGAAIAEAVQAGDPEMLSCWSAWLAEMSGRPHLGAAVRAMEARVKARRAG